ncbi:Fe(3+)-hydroxamate ABC transporter permease FhuB [Falsirhodobacter halotolerans]|uniref:Fe(3+)-hydroxamate ABC transporter permease FhuB n=1 Tax=Falsirhodobacter halotolerans TaxID=1146892 RepID=UPI001FD44230|nr:Fe(3+)-hydroxamate ABC transporter permease FhuB [Falsirhodobacter halotolerans]MCJ8141145.1 Fe(3+)-hydroxamate ABC transporter permease FhuB [Falsirhodobacter halotolerans]
MIRSAAIGGAMTLAAGLWLLAAIPLAGGHWPPFPFDPATMTLDQIRLAFGLMPRGVMALIAGAMLGLSGAVLQVVLRNPVADPTTLGIQSGAQVALVFGTIAAPGLMDYGRWPLAYGGAALAAALVMGIGARRAFAPVTMVIAGMLVGMTCSAIATAVTLSQGEYLLSLVIWNGGSLVQQDWSGVRTLLAILIVGAAVAAALARPLRVLSLGVQGAQGLGLNVRLIRFLAVMVAVVMAASVSAEVGLIAFVGLAGPAVARTLGIRGIGHLMIWSALSGAVLLSLSDGVVLMLAGRGAESFPTGALTGLIGGPLLIALLPRLRGSTPPGTEQAEGVIHRARRPLRRMLGMAAGIMLAGMVFLWVGRLPGGWAVLDRDSMAAFLPLRLPRLVAATAAGAALGLAGAILQRLTANPLASPEVLGVSGGAALGYAATVLALTTPGIVALSVGAMMGAAGALGVVALFTRRRQMPPERILLAGIAVSALASAVLATIMSVGDTRAFVILAWLSGSAASVTPLGAAALTGVVAVVAGAAVAARRWLAILPLGAGIADGVGVGTVQARLALILTAGVAIGGATILVGPLSFVGLMAPHMARRLGLMSPGAHLAGAALIGAGLMLAADFGARMAGFPYELPLGLFASLIGAPWLIGLMMRRVR